jgi:hypothetical protein
MQPKSNNILEQTARQAVLAPPPVLPRIMPEFIRLPKPGTTCDWTGLSRSKMWEIIQTGKVKTVSLRPPGAAKGARLVHLASLVTYLHSRAEGGER